MLCLTTSITLRDRPLAATIQRRCLKHLVEAAGPLPSLFDQGLGADTSFSEDGSDASKRVRGNSLEELNLLEGLYIGETYIHVPFSYLGWNFNEYVQVTQATHPKEYTSLLLDWVIWYERHIHYPL